MKNLSGLILLLVLAAGCQQPAEVKLTMDGDQTTLEVRPVVVPDTNLVLRPIDTLAVLPEEQLSFKAQFLVHRITLDAGSGRTTFAYSRVFVADTAVLWMNRTVGYDGRDLGSVSLNGITMVEIAHRIPVLRLASKDTTIVRGVEYVADLTGTYQPLTTYTWSSTASVSSLQAQAVRTPEALKVLSPAGGALVSRDRDLLLRWEGGAGRLTIVLSIFYPLTKRTRPLLELRPLANTGKAVIPAKLLQSLPSLERFYVFTFVLANRSTTDPTQPAGTKILAQAADVYNSFVELR